MEHPHVQKEGLIHRGETRAAHIVQLILSKVRIIPMAIPKAEHIATQAIVQAPWSVMAFIAVENAKT
jgi:hypothetical protein